MATIWEGGGRVLGPRLEHPAVKEHYSPALGVSHYCINSCFCQLESFPPAPFTFRNKVKNRLHAAHGFVHSLRQSRGRGSGACAQLRKPTGQGHLHTPPGKGSAAGRCSGGTPAEGTGLGAGREHVCSSVCIITNQCPKQCNVESMHRKQVEVPSRVELPPSGLLNPLPRGPGPRLPSLPGPPRLQLPLPHPPGAGLTVSLGPRGPGTRQVPRPLTQTRPGPARASPLPPHLWGWGVGEGGVSPGSPAAGCPRGTGHPSRRHRWVLGSPAPPVSRRARRRKGWKRRTRDAAPPA